MQDGVGPAAVQVGQRVAHLQKPGQSVLHPDRPVAFNALAEVGALDEIHDQILPLARKHEVIDYPWQIGMAQAGQDGGFVMELAGVLFGGEQVFFDCHRDAEVEILGPVHSAHPPLAEDTFDLVAVA